MNKHNQTLYRAGRKRRKYLLKLSESMSYADIARQEGLTRQRVQQMVAQALKERE